MNCYDVPVLLMSFVSRLLIAVVDLNTHRFRSYVADDFLFYFCQHSDSSCFFLLFLEMYLLKLHICSLIPVSFWEDGETFSVSWSA